MIKKRTIYVTAFSIASISLGIGYYHLTNSQNFENTSSVYKTELLNIVESRDFDKYNSTILDFNLGSEVFGENEEAVKIDLKGIIGVPKSLQKAPIVFILSGNNNSINAKDNSVEKDTYQGFNYLVEFLSKSGFLTIAINTDIDFGESNQEYVVEDKILNLVFERHYEYLEDAIRGINNKYPISLYNKGDTENIGLIGQGNTAKTIYNIANQQNINEINNIKGLLAIAPREGTTVSSYPDIPSAILSTEHSANTPISFDMYNDIEKINERNSFSQLTYLIGGDSSKFNDLVKEDTLFSEKLSLTSNQNLEMGISRASINTNEDTILDDSSHKDFLSQYSRDFFKYIFNNETDNSLYNSSSPTIQKLYKRDILSKLHINNKKHLFNYSTYSDILSFDNIKSKTVIESSINSLDTAIDFNEPTTNIELNLLQLDWKSKNATLNIDMNNSNINLSQYNSISIEWALNHSSDLNTNDLNKVSIIMEDEDNESQVILLDESSLNKIQGTSESVFIENKTISNWSRFTPISETRIPIDLFKDIDINKVKNIKINFGENESGSIYIKSIYLNKK